MACDLVWGEDPESIGPLGIDYKYMTECSFEGMSSFFLVILSIWIIFLINLLADTASNYFSPTLGSICDKLDLAYDIAGVTFLALGNGAPDFFSLLASFSGGIDLLVAVSALLGGSVFVTTIVVGSIAILCPCEVSRNSFLRDTLFHFLSGICVLVIALIGKANILISLFLVGLYLFYVITVMSSSVIDSIFSYSILEDKSKEIKMQNLLNNDDIQTAFWLRDDKKTNAALNATISKQENKVPTSSPKAPKNAHKKSPISGGIEYSFLFLNDSVSDLDGEKNEGLTDSETFNQLNPTINLSGGYCPPFEDIIDEDYFALENEKLPHYKRFNDASSFVDEDEESSLKQSLLSPREDSGEQAVEELDGFSRRKASTYSSLISSMYWQQWLYKRKFMQTKLATEWPNYPFYYKIYYLIEYPFILVRGLTIPTLDTEHWSKLLAVAHPLSIPLFLVFLFGYSGSYVFYLPMSIFCLLIGAGPSFLIYLFTHQSHPPTDRLFVFAWTLTAFAMCIFWVYLLAGELLTCLTVLGQELHISPSFLGLTILAWGNSMGDFFTNTAVARQGFGEMAIAGCYAGPVFNILIGFGVSLLYGSLTSYPSWFPIRLDTSSMVSLVFLFISLTSTIIMVHLSNYKIERTFGFYLLALYVVYSFCQAIILFTQ